MGWREVGQPCCPAAKKVHPQVPHYSHDRELGAEEHAKPVEVGRERTWGEGEE